MDALRLRLEEKESFLNKKTKQLQDLTEEKGTLAGEIRDMKDMLEVKERKINVLQKKVRPPGRDGEMRWAEKRKQRERERGEEATQRCPAVLMCLSPPRVYISPLRPD